MDDVQGILARSALFRGVQMALVSEVSSSSEARLLGRNERLLSAGRPSEKLHLVLSGGLVIQPAAGQVEATRLGPGDCVGAASLFEHRDVTADVFAEESTIVLSLDRERLWFLVDASPEFARNLLRVLTGRLPNEDVVPGQSTRLKRYFERISTVDSLTGLHNRRWVDDALPRQLDRAQRSNQAVAILMIDIDHLRRVNEHFGHLAGDAVLGRVSQILMAGVRPQDLLARYGAEEFLVILPSADLDAAVAVAERLRRSVEATARDDDAQDVPTTTVSIGAATLVPGERPDDLLNRAELAVSRAKATGRNRTCR